MKQYFIDYSLSLCRFFYVKVNYFYYFPKTYQTIWLCIRTCILVLVFGYISTFTLYSQNLSNFRYKVLPYQQDTIQLDSLSIVPNTTIISIKDRIVSIDNYKIDEAGSFLFLNKGIFSSNDTLYVSYRVFPYLLSKTLSHKSFAEKKKGDIGILMNPFEYKPAEEKSTLQFGGLDYSGSLSRGISFGNNQDLILNSSLNLQLNGFINPDIEVQASVTDNNIPLQPEGNTQNLQEFDKIYILLKLYKNHSVLLGDILNNNQTATYYKKYVRNIQGLQYAGNIDFGKYGKLKVDAMGGAARGKYARNELAVTEGNQGPYKLRGNNGESFIIILAGSERVYVNSQLMKRGLDQDYVIDYNLGEIVFTPKRLITKDLRVTVEFNYSERSYIRTVFDAALTYSYKKFEVGVGAYSEQDAKNQSTAQNLSDAQKALLRNVGDSLQNAKQLSARTEAYSVDRIFYQLTDSLTPSGVYYDSIFTYSYDSTETLYYVVFTFVGEGKGNYILASSGSNGRVYAWVEPQGGVLRGNYEPIMQLIAPSSIRMYTITSRYTWNEKNILQGELAVSQFDPNTFSDIDNKYHTGIASTLQYKNTRILKRKDSLATLSLQSTLQYDFIYKNFNTIERFRDVQFSRNWNNEDINTRKTNEHFAFSSFNFLTRSNGNVLYKLTFFLRESFYQGFEHTIESKLYGKQWQLQTNSTVLHATSITRKSLFIKPNSTLFYKIKPLRNWKIKLSVDNEYNISRNILSDTLDATSRHWQQYSFGVLSSDSMKNKYSIEYTHRREQRALVYELEKAHFIANTLNISGEILSKTRHQFAWNLTYRNIQEIDSLLARNYLKNYYLGRIEYRMSELKGMFKSTLFYELGSGREPKTEFTYIEAPNGNGQYAYTDINNNGVRELNEYYISQFNDLNRYIKLFNTTSELVPVNTTTLNASLTIQPSAYLKSKQRFIRWINTLSTLTTIQLTKKNFASSATPVAQYFNPTSSGLNDSQLVSNAFIVRNSIFFNRIHPKYAAEYTVSFNNNRTLLTNGFETRKSLNHQWKVRWNITKSISWNANYVNGYKSNYSAFFTDRRFVIVINETQHEFSYIFKQLIRASITYNYSFQSNSHPETAGQFMVMNALKSEFKFTSLKQGNASASFSFVNIAYKDTREKNSQVEFTMLQGLQNGRNYIWNLTFARKLSDNIELLMSYDGRKTGQNAKVIHTGSAQIRAVF